MLQHHQTLFTFLHLAPDPQQTELLLASGANCIGYETVADTKGNLSLLAPMSEVAGRLSVQAAAHHLEKAQGGSGILLGGIPGVAPGKVLIIGGGVAGRNAAIIAIGIGAEVTVLDRSLPCLRALDQQFGRRIKTAYSSETAITHYAAEADVIIGCVLIPGATAPKLLRKHHLLTMRNGSVIVDVAIDQGGCFETSVPTTHENPTFTVDGVTHYCVTNMPGAVSRTATIALNNATLPFIIELANNGVRSALLNNKALLNGLNISAGKITNAAVAHALGMAHSPASDALNIS